MFCKYLIFSKVVSWTHQFARKKQQLMHMWESFCVYRVADALLIDGSLEWKFLAYFGTISLTVSSRAAKAYIHYWKVSTFLLLLHMSSITMCTHHPTVRKREFGARGAREMSRFEPNSGTGELFYIHNEKRHQWI